MTANSDDIPGVVTARMILTPAGMTDLDDIAALHSDERVWRHRPEGRHQSVEHTRGKVADMAHQWTRDGLGYWVARLQQPIEDVAAGTFVGVGGCAILPNADWWNLYYRFRPELQGHGLAAELSRAAIDAARRVNGKLPIVASLVAGNEASKRTAERAGLRTQWRGPDPGGSGGQRLILADRSLDPDQLTAVIKSS